MVLKQIRSNDGTGTLSYLMADETTKNGIVVDPNLEDVQTIQNLAGGLGIRITRIIDTHTHADHISSAGELKTLFGAQYIMHENTKHKWKVVDQGDQFGIGDILRANAAFEVDRYVSDGDTVAVDSLQFKVLFTPGHSDNHIALSVGDALFTGDVLLIGQAGRSDLPTGNPAEQYESIFGKILAFPDQTKIYPGHDYAEKVYSPLGQEKVSNPFLQRRTREEYVDFVKNFFPPLAEVAAGGKMTLQCGVERVTTASDPFISVTPQELATIMKKEPSLFLLDVREPFELVSFGAVPGVTNIPVKQLARRMNELPGDKSMPIVSICQSGNRSREAAHFLVKQGYTSVMNLKGGTGAWVKSGNPVRRGDLP